MKTNEVSRAADFRGRYLIVTDGIGQATWPECWGAHARFRGRAVADADTVGEAVASCPAGGWIIDRATGRPVGRSRLAAAANSTF